MVFCVFLSGERGILTLSHFLKNKLEPIEVFIVDGKGEIEERVCELVGGSINVKVVNSVNDTNFINHLKSLDLDFGVVAGFPTIFKAELIKSTLFGMINQHAGRLPNYRGGSPLNWQIINGERFIGISVLKMDEGIDSGQVLASAEFPLSVDEDISHAHMKANELFGPITLHAIERLLNGSYPSTAVSSDSTYWHQRNDSDGIIHWDRSTAEEVVNLVRGVAPPYPGAFCFSSKQIIRVYRASVPHEVYRGDPGRVFFVQGKGPLVCARDRAVLLKDYSIVPISGFDNKFINSRLRTGDRLGAYCQYEI